MDDMLKVTTGTEADVQASPTSEPCIMLVFGASGDLTKRLLVPALYNLECDGLLHENFALLGTAIVAGLSLGTSVSGVAIEQLGLTGALALAAPCVGVATLLAIAGRGSLRVSEAVP